MEILKKAGVFLSVGKDRRKDRWSLLDALALTTLIILVSLYDPFGINRRILDFLRLNFFIFTREPKLLYYSQIYMSGIVFKTLSLVFIAAVTFMRRISIKELVLANPRRSLDANFWGLFTLGCLCVHLFFLNDPVRANIPFNSVFTDAFIAGNIIIVFSVLFVAPLVEEIVFRGFLFPSFNKHLGVYPAMFVVSLLFTVAHYPQIQDEVIFTAVLFFLSAVITYVRMKTGSTLYAIVMHFIYNLTCVAVGYAAFAIMGY